MIHNSLFTALNKSIGSNYEESESDLSEDDDYDDSDWSISKYLKKIEKHTSKSFL